MIENLVKGDILFVMRIFFTSISMFLFLIGSQTFADASKKKELEAGQKRVTLQNALKAAEKFHPIAGQSFPSLDYEFLEWLVFGEKHDGLSPRTFVMVNCNRFFSDPKNRSDNNKDILATCNSWGWPPKNDSSFWNFIIKKH